MVGNMCLRFWYNSIRYLKWYSNLPSNRRLTLLLSSSPDSVALPISGE